MQPCLVRALRRAVVPTGLVLTAFTPLGGAQVVFSIDYTSTTIGAAPSFGAFAITEGDLLTPAPGNPAIGPLPVPGIDVSVGFGGLGLAGHTGCVGHPPGVPCIVEVDAVSYGRDGRFDPVVGFGAGSLWFSVDAYSTGFAGPFAPGVGSEGGAIGDLVLAAMSFRGDLAMSTVDPGCDDRADGP
jgi:hypothetical protein